MGEVIQFPKRNPERNEDRLIEEARALYESIFPTEKDSAGVQQDPPARTL